MSAWRAILCIGLELVVARFVSSEREMNIIYISLGTVVLELVLRRVIIVSVAEAHPFCF